MKNVNEVLSPIRYIRDEFGADIAENVEDLAIVLAEGEIPASREYNKLRCACEKLTQGELTDLANFAENVSDMWLENVSRNERHR